MRIVSWNLWWRFGPEWEQRQARIAAALARLRPDVVGLQEVWAGTGDSQAEMLAAPLSMDARFASPSLPPVPNPPQSPDQIGMELGVAVLSRWPVRHAAEHRLPSRHRDPAPVALLATIDHPDGPLHVVSACIEWEPAFVDDQFAQAAALADLVTSPALDGPMPVVLTADLNAAPQANPLRPLTDVLIDAWVAAGRRDEGVTLSSTNRFAPLEATEQIDRRIDYVLLRPGRPGATVRAAHAFVDDGNGFPPSDHYPVVVDLDC